jgi:transcriptional regulator with XRE-family HTH domain
MQILDKKAIAKRLKLWREENNLSSRKFSLSAGVDPAHYSKVEGEKMYVTDTMLVKFFEKYTTLNRNYILYGTAGIPVESVPNATAEEPKAANAGSPLEVAEKIVALMPPVSPGMMNEQLYQHFAARENKLMLAYNLLKQTVQELEIKLANRNNGGK